MDRGKRGPDIVTNVETSREKRNVTASSVLHIENLSVIYNTLNGIVNAVRDVSLVVHKGETLGIVGESGCGKSSLAYAIMGYLGRNGLVTEGAILLHEQNLLSLSAKELCKFRGSRIAMVYQDPHTALNPSMRVGRQIAEAYQVHSGESNQDCTIRAAEMLERVGLPDPERIADQYSHQLSGGQQQRVVIAMSLVNNPDLLIMDEPTTGLDVTTEALILDLINRLRQEFGAAILYITHNLGVIAQVCDHVTVMYAGECVEEGNVNTIFGQPSHPYTAALLDCVPRRGMSKQKQLLKSIPGYLPPTTEVPEGCAFAPRCTYVQDACRNVTPRLLETSVDDHFTRCLYWDELELLSRNAETEIVPQMLDHSREKSIGSPETILEVQGLRVYFGRIQGKLNRILRHFTSPKKQVRAIDGISFDLHHGETLAIVGESGCGKTTLANTIAGVVRPTSGSIQFLGHNIALTADRRPRLLRRHLQMVFQNPDSSLNPRHRVGQIIERPMKVFLSLSRKELHQKSIELLQEMQLDSSYYERASIQLSGGEKQRVSIARAFAGEPRLVICDEAVSALDVSVQAAIINMLVALQRNRGTSYLFISHDLGVVRYLADRIGVMYLGRLVEIGNTEDLFEPPYHPYVEALLSAIPEPDPGVKPKHIYLQGPVPSPTIEIMGCSFASRCPRYIGLICDDAPPPIREADHRHRILCHLTLEQLSNLDPAEVASSDNGW